eukprot:5336680-Pleurochrysis_carterae.AAC.1
MRAWVCACLKRGATVPDCSIRLRACSKCSQGCLLHGILRFTGGAVALAMALRFNTDREDAVRWGCSALGHMAKRSRDGAKA